MSQAMWSVLEAWSEPYVIYKAVLEKWFDPISFKVNNVIFNLQYCSNDVLISVGTQRHVCLLCTVLINCALLGMLGAHVHKQTATSDMNMYQFNF